MLATKALRLAIGLALLAILTTGDPSAAPVTETAASDVDLGELIRGASAEAVFILRNTGDETLRILGVEPG